MDKRKISILMAGIILFLIFDLTINAVGAQYQRQLINKQNQEMTIIRNEAIKQAKIDYAKKKKALAIQVELKKQAAIKKAMLVKEANRKLAIKKKAEQKRITPSRGGDILDSSGYWIDVRLTYYTNSVSDCGKTDAIAASGKHLNDGGNYVAAPKGISFGTRMYIEGRGNYVVEDRGGAITYRNGVMMLDVYVPNASNSYLRRLGVTHTRAKIYN